MERSITMASVGAACAVLASCASVEVNKVDSATGRVVADAAPGLRFYLPRPYVSVFEPFIVSSEVYLASGEMSPDSNFVLLNDIPEGLRTIANDKLVKGTQAMPGLRVDASQVNAAAPGRGPQSAAAAADAASAAASAASSSMTGTPKPSGGVLNIKAVNDNAAYAVTPQPRYFNILWLPDFDEQYVVSAKAGLGNAGVVLGFGQGWSLQSLDATIDNSSLAKPLLDFYSGTLGALQKVATAKIEGPLAMLTGKPQSAAAPDARSFAGGTPVTLKVTKVRIVAPGLYPVLKPKEIAEKATLTDAEAKRILAPKPPFTNIAFNTYDVVVIEAARTTGDSALRIQQYVDSTSGAVSPASTAGGSGTATVPNDAVKALNIELSKPENTTTTKDYFVARVTQGAGVVSVTLDRKSNGNAGTAAALMDDTALKSFVTKQLQAHGVDVNGDIKINR